MKLRFLLLPAYFLILSQSFAQIIHEPGTPASWTQFKSPTADVPVMKMPAFDLEAQLAEDAVNDQEKSGPWRFGFPFQTAYDLENSGVWHDLENGERIWRIALHSPGALSMNVIFDQYVLVPGDQLFIYNADRSEVIGPLTYLNNKSWEGLATSPVMGETIVVELLQRHPGLAQKSILRIGQVTHGYRDIFGYARRIYEKGLGDSGSCNNNVICPEGDPWRCEISAVAIIVVNGSGACTGTVLNNHAQDQRPLFLSANHCGTNVTNWVFRFNWDSPTCTPTQNGPTNQSVSGATLLANSAGSDFALMELSSAIPAGYNVYYSGWDATGVLPNSQTGIHHPSGDVKKISFDDDPAQPASFGGAACWNIENWEDGTTEPGSSGSGLWNQDHHLIGQLYGGSASCSSITDDYFGRLDVSWEGGGSPSTRVKDYLDPNNTGLKVLDGLGQGPCAGIVYDLDAMVVSINGIDANYCNQSSVAPSITLKNNGNLTLTSLSISYTLNGGASSGTIPWTGTLAPSATTSVALPTLNFANGANTLTVTSASPNGSVDMNTINDSKTANWNVFLNGVTVTVDVVLDGYGSETRWEILDGTNVVYSGGPYSDNNNQMLISTDVCLNAGSCYNFVIYDQFGDGICCAYGNGSYTVYGAGNTYASGAQFGFQESTQFCPVLSLEEEKLSRVRIYPNPTEGLLNVEWGKEGETEARIRVLDASGHVLSEQIAQAPLTQLDLRKQESGLYFVEISHEKGRSVHKISVKK
jgi:hypothetical protein